MRHRYSGLNPNQHVTQRHRPVNTYLKNRTIPGTWYIGENMILRTFWDRVSGAKVVPGMLYYNIAALHSMMRLHQHLPLADARKRGKHITKPQHLLTEPRRVYCSPVYTAPPANKNDDSRSVVQEQRKVRSNIRNTTIKKRVKRFRQPYTASTVQHVLMPQQQQQQQLRLQRYHQRSTTRAHLEPNVVLQHVGSSLLLYLYHQKKENKRQFNFTALET